MIDHIKGFIRFEGPISVKSTTWLLNELDAKLKEYKQVILYFTCNGGSISDSRVVIDYMNRYHSRIEMICTWTLASCGLDIALFFKGRKSIIGSVYGLIHLGTNTFDSLDEMDKKSFTAFNRECLNQNNRAYLRKLKPLLTDDEYDRVRKGEDVYLNAARLRTLLNCK